MLIIISIATCFGYTLYHFYAFSGTNLLTRCHSASSLFSAVFRFRNPRKEISSESDEINYTVNKRSRRSRSPEGTWGGSPQVVFGLRKLPGLLFTEEQISPDFDDIFRVGFSKTKNSRKTELALGHLVNRLVPENA